MTNHKIILRTVYTNGCYLTCEKDSTINHAKILIKRMSFENVLKCQICESSSLIPCCDRFVSKFFKLFLKISDKSLANNLVLILFLEGFVLTVLIIRIFLFQERYINEMAKSKNHTNHNQSE